jgi:murein DD-endopeptidase MepM/ murein hydrolase activator NlpD
MVQISAELEKVLKERLKIGDFTKPVYRVEVDRLAFVPGRVEDLTMNVSYRQDVKRVQRTWISSNGNGESALNYTDFVFPAKGYSKDADITDQYGTRGGKHKGIDIGCPMGTEIYAVWGGVVKIADSSREYDGAGKYVVIEHEDGFLTKYFHMSRIDASVGQRVGQGDIIGLSGNTGNVRGGGAIPTGTYDDPNSERAKGKGAHLHFEIHKPGKDGVPVAIDPYPFIYGKQKLFSATVNVGDVVDDGDVDVRVGSVLYSEEFTSRNWYNGENYGYSSNLPDKHAVDITKGQAVLTLQTDDVVDIHYFLKNPNPSLLSARFATNFMDGDAEFQIFVNNKLAINVKKFNAGDMSIFQDVVDRYIPPQTSGSSVTVTFRISYRGTGTGEFRFENFSLKTILEIPEWMVNNVVGKSNTANYEGYWDEVEVTDNLTFTRMDKVPLDVGSFVYMDTLPLENVQSISTDNQFEAESSTLTMTLSNANGFYSPDYNPSLFPEDLLEPSPFTYQINGATISVLSENTPIRVYFGYGMNIVRIFTGLIDRAELSADNATITINCRDMYKRAIEKVLVDDLYYPRDLAEQHTDIQDPVLDNAPNPVDYSGLTRKQKIIYKAQQYASEYAVDYRLAVAISQHETNLGTTGMGTEEKGGYICGYGVRDDGGKLQTEYSGIDCQMKFVCKRIKEALNGRPTTPDNIRYLWKGGDKGTAYQYASDTRWADGVWSSYQEVINDPEVNLQFFKGTAAGTTPTPEEKEAKKGEAQWLKSAIVHDLMTRCGLHSWRVTAEDLQYPDFVIEESYVIEVDQAKGKVIKATSNPGEFILEDIESVPTINGWMNGFAHQPVKFDAWKFKVNECVREVMKDTNYRAYCDRYGTFRLEKIRWNKPVRGQYIEGENLISLSKSVDFSRGRSHLIVVDETDKYMSFIDSDILQELKGELRSAMISVGWAKTDKMKQEIAKRLFWDMKRLCRTLSVAIPVDPTLEVLDRIYVVSKRTATRDTFIIKGIKTTISNTGAIQQLDLMWANNGGVIY